MSQKFFRYNTLLDLKNNVEDKISVFVTTGPLVGQVLEYSNIRYNKVDDILYYNYSFQTPIEVEDTFNFNDYLKSILVAHLVFKEEGSIS